MSVTNTATSRTTNPTQVADQLLLQVERSITERLAGETGRWEAEDPSSAPVASALKRFVTNGGKRLRPVFCIWGFIAADGDPSDPAIIAVARALELLHAFALIHDDVMDGSATRRNSPSVHAHFTSRHTRDGAVGESRRYGEAMAILTGDLAHVLAEQSLTHAPAAVRAAWYELQLELIRGQALDIAAAAHRRYDAALARRVALLKSGRYTVVRPLVLGALTAGRPELEPALVAFGDPVGAAFQLRDDLLGAFGATARTGKPVGDDLREGKSTALVAAARARVSGADAALLDRIGEPELDTATIARIQQLLADCGARDDVERTIDALVAEARAALDEVPIDDDTRSALWGLVVSAVWRQA